MSTMSPMLKRWMMSRFGECDDDVCLLLSSLALAVDGLFLCLLAGGLGGMYWLDGEELIAGA